VIREQKTTVDYLSFRTQARPEACLEGLRPLFGESAPLLRLERLRHGKDGWREGCDVRLADMRIGRLDHGGEAMRGWVRVQMEGKGCSWVKDWDAIESVEELPEAEIRRFDAALTTWRGEVSHDRVVQAHAAGRFTTGGRPPNLEQRTHSQTSKGRTCSIGERASDKFGRFYEKGFEMLSKLPEADREAVTDIDGFAVDGIYRSEIEFKAKTRPIPWAVIDGRDQYFCGAYPFCADILPGVEADILQRRPERAAQASLSAALANCRHAYGNTLYTALRAYQGDMGAVWDLIVGKQHNEALLQAGVLMVDHYAEAS
jgi:DNA relaxase NicK